MQLFDYMNIRCHDLDVYGMLPTIKTGKHFNKIGERLELAGLMPLWKREFDIHKDSSKSLLAICIFVICICSVIFDFLTIIIAFLLCVLAFVGTKLLSGEGIYRHIDWPVIILIAAMIPIGNTLNEYGI